MSQTYDLSSLDQSVATTGSSNISFRLNGPDLLSRTDREFAYDDYWVWEIPTLRPLVNMSLVVHNAADNQYACFVSGSNNFLSDFRSTQGYTDGLVTNYLMRQAHQIALPWLLQYFLSNETALQKYEIRERYTAATFAAVESAQLGLILLFDPTTGLPHAVRSLEDHVIYGLSTNDLVFTNWTSTVIKDNLSFLLPHRLQTVYNTLYVLEDIMIDSVMMNPSFPGDFFVGRAPQSDPSNVVQGLTPMKPVTSAEYPLSEVHEWYEAGIWTGPFTQQYNISDVVLSYPDPSFRYIMQLYVGYIDYVQLLVEHEAGFIITDAPPHRSKIILEWLALNRPDKRITHVVPTHHHSDHADGVIDYVRAGAKLVVPDVARNYYQQGDTNKTQYHIVTYDDEHPFVLKDRLIDFRSYWAHDNPHTEDQVFPVATRANATDSDPFILYEADIVNPGSAAVYYKSLYAWDMLVRASKIGLPQSTLVVSAHIHGANLTNVSNVEALTTVGDSIGFSYPNLTINDWKACNIKGCIM